MRKEGHIRQGSQGSPGASSTAHRELERLRGRRLGSQRAPESCGPPGLRDRKHHCRAGRRLEACSTPAARAPRSQPVWRPFPFVPRRRPRPALPPSQGSPSSKRSSGRRAPGAAMARRSRGRDAAVARPAGGRVHRLERPGSCGAGTERTLRPAAPVT